MTRGRKRTWPVEHPHTLPCTGPRHSTKRVNSSTSLSVNLLIPYSGLFHIGRRLSGHWYQQCVDHPSRYRFVYYPDHKFTGNHLRLRRGLVLHGTFERESRRDDSKPTSNPVVVSRPDVPTVVTAAPLWSKNSMTLSPKTSPGGCRHSVASQHAGHRERTCPLSRSNR